MGDYRTEIDGRLPEGAKTRLRRRNKVLFVFAVSVVAAALAGRFISVESTVNALGFVTSEEHAEVRAAAPGIVAAILARTGDFVEKDELLVRLDQGEELPALAEARSRYNKAEAELILRRAQVEEAARLRGDRIRLAELQLKHAENRLQRTRELSVRGLVAGAVLADAEHDVRLLEVELDKLQRHNETLDEKELLVLERELEARRDAVAAAEARLYSREIRAPIAGQVLRYSFVPGELVRSDAVLMEIFGGPRQVLKLRISERHAMRVQPGDRYEARVGAYRGARNAVFTGNVELLRNVIQDADRTPYRAAYCSFDAGGRAVPPGTSAEARIFTGKVPLWRWLTGWQ